MAIVEQEPRQEERPRSTIDPETGQLQIDVEFYQKSQELARWVLQQRQEWQDTLRQFEEEHGPIESSPS